MKVVILTNDQGNQKALCNKIAEICDVAAIVLSKNIPRKKPSVGKKIRVFINRIANRFFGRPFVAAWFKMLREYENRYPNFPDAPIIRVDNVNDLAAIDALEKFKPDLIIVSGTNLVGKKAIEIAGQGKGIVNLHTGISPFVKGGPNCTNWCLAKNWFHLIGNTIMWLDSGIDSGKIITTEQTPLEGSESLFELHWKVMEHAHDLYLRVLTHLAEGREVPAVPQNSIGEGTLFYTADWNFAAMRNAQINFENNYTQFFEAENAGRRKELSWELTLVPLV